MSARSGDIKYDLKTIKNRLKWEKIISHFKRLCFSNFAVGYSDIYNYLGLEDLFDITQQEESKTQ